MPTYTYRCGNCDHRFDLHQGFADPDPTVCPRCSHLNELQRVYKPVGVVFRGSGFYTTDHKSASRVSSNGSKPAADTVEPSKNGAKGSESAASPSTSESAVSSGDSS